MPHYLSPKRRMLVASCVSAVVLAGWLPATSAPRSQAETGGVPIRVTAAPLTAAAEPCTGSFVAYDLDHRTVVPGDTVDHFEANGAGVAIGDLDRDGDLDIVLANHAGSNTLLWNDGGLRFRTERMDHGDSRAVNLVDVDADGWLDLVFTRRTGGMTWWKNQGQAGEPGRFERQILPGVAQPAYAMAWGDLDADGDLDLVTGSYDASLLDDLGNEFLLKGGGGVTVYENRNGKFRPTQLESKAQAMAIVLFDIDRDGLRDIVVGNDFAVPDYAWDRTDGGWQRTAFETTSHSTMSLDAGDVDNDGQVELFSTDMMPIDSSPESVAAWDPLMADMIDPIDPADPQIMSNVLQVSTPQAGYQNAARPRGVDATGWSWSAKFGDLDQDGLLDLYVVNGMIESTLLAHLPDHELVEPNQAMRNMGDGFYRPAPEWQLGSTRSGRGMSQADLDGDGDLDIVVNNLRSPAQLFENRLCGGHSLLVDLRWPGSANTHAIGAELALTTSAGTFTRDVRSGSGYLSGDPARLHFGMPAGASIEALEIRWPDGVRSTLDKLQPNTLVTVSREDPIRPGQTQPEQSDSTDTTLRALIAQHGLAGDPSTGRDLPDIEEPLAQLGMQLFFTKGLGGDKDSACVTCHHPLLGGGDGLALSIGVGAPEPDLLGPGRTHPSGYFNVPRNAPTTFNIGLWDQVLFFDGRVESLGKTAGKNGADGRGIRTPDTRHGTADPHAGDTLAAAQARFPVTSKEEMRGETFEVHRPNRLVREHLAGRLGGYGAGAGELDTNRWLAEFQRVWGSRDAETLVSYDAIAAALAAYERSQVFVDTPWRAYVQGDDAAIGEAAKRGALLFYRSVAEGGAGCAACHRGDFFTDEQFYTLAIPQIGKGKGDGPFGDDDFGRYRETGRPEDLYAFRTPALLNVEVTGPYGHDGAYETLEGIVRHHLDPVAAVESFDPRLVDPAAKTTHIALNTQRALAKLAADRQVGRTPLQDVELAPGQVDDLVSFLLTLTDPCVKNPSCLAPWIPDATDANPDGLRVEARLPSGIGVQVSAGLKLR
jgi:cytochrome c peroxidase